MDDFFKGEHLLLRALEPEDLDNLYKWENTTGVWGISDTVVPYSKCVLKEFIATFSNDIYEEKQLRLMIVRHADDQVIGAVDIFDFDPFHSRAGIGIFIDEPFRKAGYAHEAISLIINYSMKFIGIHQLYSTIPEDNLMSLALFKKLGFQITGERKEWLRGMDGYITEYFLQLIG